MDVGVRRGQACWVRSEEEFRARLAKGREVASSLVGLDLPAAVQRVAQKGYEAEVVPVDVEAVTLDLDSRRIRLFMDEHNVVVRASAG